jgi:putative methionine-R-sulfoxide reductase with GAF domain
MIVALIGSVLVLLASLIQVQGKFQLTSLTISGIVGTITCLISLWLLRLKYIAIPRTLLPIIVYLLATYLIFTGATVSVRDDAVLMYALVIAMAGLLLRRRGVVIFGALSIATVVASVYAELNGVIVNHITTNTSTYYTMMTVGVTYGLTFSMIYILVSILNNNLIRSQLEQGELTAANDQLISAREALEQLVEARATAAEKARAEAEAARQEAEAQAWVTSGQADLAEKMRGDVDSAALANNVISFLCEYLGAQTGALFLPTGDHLTLTGRYPFGEHPDQKREFRLGEGMIGEVARARRMIRVGDIPKGAQFVSPNLTIANLKQLLIVPIETDGQVFGVAALGTSNQFTAEHEAFLRLVSESIAIALRSVQTRIWVNGLLAQSLRQTKN